MPTADELLGRDVVVDLIACLGRTVPELRPAALGRAADALGPLAFGERVTLVADATLEDLPDGLDAFAGVLRRALEDDAFSGWMIWAVAEAAARRALAAPQDDALEVGLALMRELAFSLTLTNGGPEPLALAVDYVVHYRKANGTTAPKVFKLATATLAPGATVSWSRTRSFRPITTRRFHPGGHALEVQVNGRRYGRVPFELLPDA